MTDRSRTHRRTHCTYFESSLNTDVLRKQQEQQLVKTFYTQKNVRIINAMHFSAKRGIAIDRISSACLSPSVCPSVTLVNCDHIGWNSSKIISPLLSLGCLLFATPTWRVCSKRNTPKFWLKVTHPLLIWASETFDRKLRPNGYR